jgi:hypothetical protein
MEEILSVERRLAELQAEIDDVGRQFRLLNDLIDYSTITLELLGPISTAKFSERVTGLMASFGNYVSMIFLVLLAIIVYGIPAVIILLLLYWVLFGRIGLIKKAIGLLSEKNK